MIGNCSGRNFPAGRRPIWNVSAVEHVTLLNSNQNASDKFWEPDKRIKSDRKSQGVILQIYKGEVLFDLVLLVQDEVITLDDLAEFSVDVRERVAFMVQRHW